MTTQSTYLKNVGVDQPDGTLRARVYDRVGPLRILEHIVQVELAARYAGVSNLSDPIPVDVRDLLVNPRAP